MLVRLFKSWNDADLLGHTPKRSGMWRGVKFLINEPGEADYVVIHWNYSDFARVVCPPENLWLILGEPPNSVFAKYYDSVPGWISRIFMTDPSRQSARHVLTHAGLPWHVQREFDFLVNCPVPEKPRLLSWITSNRSDTAGHQKRLRFLTDIKPVEELELFGRGFSPLPDKWDGLAPYKYSIAYENFSNSHYWTEKVMDCFLAWTMPIYYGCTDLAKFFPRESFVQLDPDIADPAAEIRRIVASGLWERSLPAIEEARNRVLKKYNPFELIVSQIESREAERPASGLARRPCTIVNYMDQWSAVKSRMPPGSLRMFRSVRRKLSACLKPGKPA